MSRNDKAESILVNGKGVRKLFSGQQDETIETDRAVLTVKTGFRYRFRLINAGVLFCPKQVSVDNHQLEIISVDGSPVEPELVDAVYLQSAERVDIVLHANSTPDNYWIKIKGTDDCETNRVFELAILNYEGVDSRKPFDTDKLEYDDIVAEGRVSQMSNMCSYFLILSPFFTFINHQTRKKKFSIYLLAFRGRRVTRAWSSSLR